MKYFLITVLILLSTFVSGQEKNLLTTFEKSDKRETATYQEGIDYWKNLAGRHEEISIYEMGMTDSGLPLHLIIYSQKKYSLNEIKNADQPVFLINNAIHAGEPDGVDASMMLLRDVAKGKVLKRAGKELIIAVIPFYNIGGVLNRNSTTRVNQNGPLSYGFRGNARNYDLNRDFVKGDTRNARSFWEIFQLLDPDFFIDTHVSNGADYQYAITLIANQKDKMTEPLRAPMEKHVKPFLYNFMEKAGESMTPFVNVYGSKPDEGFSEFPDWARYSSGYATLFNTYGFMSETHMLKPFKRRVEATYKLLEGMAQSLWANKELIMSSRQEANEKVRNLEEFPVKWQLDKESFSMLNFKGYEGSYIKSEITQQKRLFYDTKKPFQKEIKYYNSFNPEILIKKPSYYVVPQSWFKVIENLKVNNVEMRALPSDTTILVTSYQIQEYKNASNAYEGHFPHYGIKVGETEERISFRKGDMLIQMNQNCNRFIIETLEPEAEDSYFKWNYFDMILSRKESFSAYVFEELATDILASDSELAADFRRKQRDDEEFASNRYTQLNWIYERSSHKEKEYLRYPICRIE